MSTGASSLRSTNWRGGIAVATCSALLAAALSTPAFAASGPTPDDPPVGARSEAAPRIAEAPTSASSGTAQASRSQPLTPTPDAPIARTATPRPSAKPSSHTTAQPTPRPVVASVPAATSTPTSSPTRSRPASSGSAATRAAVTKDPAPRKAHRSAPRAAHVEKKTAPPAKVVSTPRDGNRLGVPAATVVLSVVSADSTPTALLVAAALLLFAAAAGGLVVGIVGRRLVRTP